MGHGRPLSPRMRGQFEKAGCKFRKVRMGPARVCVGFGPDGSFIAPEYFGARYRMLARHGVFAPLGGGPEGECRKLSACIGKVTRGPGADKSGWMGWSHRAAVIFGIGDKLFEEELVHASGWEDVPYVQMGTTTIETEEQAREAASRFVEYVS